MSLTYCVHFFCVFPLKIKIISELAAAVNTGFVFVRAAPSFIFSVAAPLCRKSRVSGGFPENGHDDVNWLTPEWMT